MRGRALVYRNDDGGQEQNHQGGKRSSRNDKDSNNKNEAAQVEGTGLHENLVSEHGKKKNIIDKYNFIEKLGQGSIGEVFLATIKEEAIGGSALKHNQSSSPNKGKAGRFFFNRVLNQYAKHKRGGGGGEGGEEPKEDGDSTSRRSLRNSQIRKNKDARVFAVKCIRTDRVEAKFLGEMQKEVTILKTLDHPNIIKAYEIYNYPLQTFIVMECCNGGDLYTRCKPYSEPRAAQISKDLLSAVLYMHQRGVVHRDIKFENVLFESESVDARIKLIDFGLSNKFAKKSKGLAGLRGSYLSGGRGSESGNADNDDSDHFDRMIMHEPVGTIYTMAPQVLQRVYTSQADLWSLGVVIYMMLCNERPFYHKKRKKMIDQIMRAKCNIKSGIWQHISNEAKDLVKSLLTLHPKVRLNAQQALNHKWLEKADNYTSDESENSDDNDGNDTTRNSNNSQNKLSKKFCNNVQNCFMDYQNKSKLKKVALNIIAHNSSTSEILELRDIFAAYDTSKDGLVSLEEFQEAMKGLNYPPETLAEMYGSIDVNANSNIDYTEFLAASIEAIGNIEEERIAETFDRIDTDDSGYITRSELQQILGKSYSKKELKNIIKEVDTDHDGKISYDEFLNHFRAQTTALCDEIEQIRDDVSDTSHCEEELIGLQANIPGGRYDR